MLLASLLNVSPFVFTQMLLQVGQSHRVVGATAMNADSSRSHSIFTLIIECIEKFDGKGDGDSHIRVGKVG